MLEDIKRALRISNSAYDSEIQNLIEAAVLDLRISGVKKIDRGDALIIRAITLYVKANFGWDNPDSVNLDKSYLMLKQHLSLSGDYNVVV